MSSYHQRGRFWGKTSFQWVSLELASDVQHDIERNQTRPWTLAHNLHRKSWLAAKRHRSLRLQVYHHKDVPTVVDDCLMLFERIVVPKSLQLRALKKLHNCHPGVTRMQALTRSYACCLGIDTHIEDVKRYKERSVTARCLQDSAEHDAHTNRAVKASLCRLRRSNESALFPCNSWRSLRVIKKFPMRTAASCSTISILRGVFQQLGVSAIPQMVVAVNGSQFTSTEFTSFCQSMGDSTCTQSSLSPTFGWPSRTFNG